MIFFREIPKNINFSVVKSFFKAVIFFGIVSYFLPIISEVISEIFFQKQIQYYGIKVPMAVSIVSVTLIIILFIFVKRTFYIFRHYIAGLSGQGGSKRINRDSPFVFYSSITNLLSIFLWFVLVVIPPFFLRQLTYWTIGIGGNWPLHEMIAIISIAVFGYFLWVAVVQDWDS